VVDYSTLLGTLLGAVVGSAITYLGAYRIERQHFARELRERIYGPMFMETNKILESVKSFESPSGIVAEKPSGLTDDYLLFTIDKGLRNKWAQAMDRLQKYRKIQYAAQMTVNEVGKQEGKALRLNMEVFLAWISVFIGSALVDSLNLQSAFFLQLSPQDFIKKEKEKWHEDLQIDVTLSGQKGSIEELENLYASTLAKLVKEPHYLSERIQRMRLVEELENLSEQIQPFVKPNSVWQRMKYWFKRTLLKG
jgi:hypothetical protein